MSLQTGEEVAITSNVLVSPVTLKIVGFELAGKRLTTRPSFLRTEDIRELSNIGFIIDSSDECIGLDDVIAIKELYELDFDLNNMQVIDKAGQKIGKIYDTVFTTNTFTIEQLCVQRPFFKSFSETDLLIHRDQIIEINRDAVVIRNQRESNRKQQSSTPLHNPFQNNQSSTPQPETTELND